MKTALLLALALALALASSCAPVPAIRRQLAPPRWLIACDAAAGIGRTCTERPEYEKRAPEMPSPRPAWP